MAPSGLFMKCHGVTESRTLIAVLAGTVAQTAGCYTGSVPPGEQLPGQAEATAIAWHQVYQQDDAPPPIAWYRDDCPLKTLDGMWHHFGIRSECCDRGTYDDASGVISLGAPGEAETTDPAAVHFEFSRFISASAFAHELMHARQARHGISDGDHLRREWFDIVPAANAALREAGL